DAHRLTQRDQHNHSWQEPGFMQDDKHPVVCVNWEDSKAFCDWLGEKDKRHYRLPTEAEWEYACRAGSNSAYFWGREDARDHAWYWDNAPKGTMEVGLKPANAWGLYDMCGNVWQRCEDGYGDYPQRSVTDPKGAENSAKRVARGGAWGNSIDFLRCANRGKDP